jgi:hypothetical protein
MSTTKALLIAGGVAVGAYLLLEAFKRPAGAPSRAPGTTNATWVSSLLNFGAVLTQTLATNGPNNYVGSGDVGIDPNTGGVYLPEGTQYGPVLPFAAAS